MADPAHITLEEATLDQLFDELKTRCTACVLIVDVEGDGLGVESHSDFRVRSFGGMFQAIGLVTFAKHQMTHFLPEAIGGDDEDDED